MKLTGRSRAGSFAHGSTSGSGNQSFSGPRRLPPYLGFVLLGLTLLMFVMCGKSGETSGGPVQDDAPTEENTRRVSAVRAAPSFLDRANAFVDGTGGLLANAAGEASKIVIYGAFAFILPPGARLGLRWIKNRAEFVRVNALDGDAYARWEEAAALAAETVAAGNQIGLNKSRHPTPNLTHSQEVERVGPRNPIPEPPLPPLSAPSYEELSEQQMFKPDQLLVGVSREGPVYRSPRKHGSMYITALSGYGKSNEMAFLACQTIDQNGIVDLIDPHSVKEESLYNYLGPLANEQVLGRPMGTDAASCKARLREIKAELYEIIDRGREPCPRLILADEGNALATHDDRELRMLFLDVMQLCAQQMRAFNVSAVVAIQHPTVQDLGGKTHGGAIRDCFGYSLCGKVPYKMAPIALRIAAANAPKDTEGLEAGEFYTVEGSRPIFLKTPLVTKADFVEVARRRLARERVTGVRMQESSYAPLSPAEAPEALTDGEAVEIAPTTPRRALVEDVDDQPGDSWEDKVIRFKADGLKDIEIVRRLWGDKAATSRAYNEKYLPMVTGVMARMAQTFAGAASPLEGGALSPDLDRMD